MCILLFFESHKRTKLFLVSLDAFDAAERAEECCEGLLSVAGLGDIFNVYCAFALLILISLAGDLLSLLRFSPRLEYFSRDRWLLRVVMSGRRGWRGRGDKAVAAQMRWHFYRYCRLNDRRRLIGWILTSRLLFMVWKIRVNIVQVVLIVGMATHLVYL